MLLSFLTDNIVAILQVVASTGIVVWIVNFLVKHGTLKERDRRHNDEIRMQVHAKNTAVAESKRFAKKIKEIHEEGAKVDPDTLTDIDRITMWHQEDEYEPTVHSDPRRDKTPAED